MRKLARTCLAIIVGGVLVGGSSVTVASADTVLDVSDPVTMMTKLAPDYVTESPEDVSVTTPTDDATNGAPKISPHVGGGPAILHLPRNSADIYASEFNYRTRVSFPDQSGFTKQVGEYSVYESGDKASYVKATPDGGQVIFTANNKSETSFSVSFNSSLIDSLLVEDGVQLLSFSDSSEFALYPAWARDASGASLPTSYQITTSTTSTKIAQLVTTTATTKYPILADPAWSYSKTHSVGNTSRTDAKNRLHKCFNCNFPIQGAPKDFPKDGTDLPLYVGIKTDGVDLLVDFHCTFEKEWTNYDQGGGYWGFRFNAAEHHVDGIGSHINFTFRSGRTSNTLTVYGYVKKSHPLHLPRAVYVAGADYAWSKFASKMKT